MESIQQQLRKVILHQIQAGKLSVGLLAKKTGYSAASVSLFVHGHRGLSLDAFECYCTAAGFVVEIYPWKVTQ